MIDDPVFVGPHAVERFRERVPGARALSYDDARAAIVDGIASHGRVSRAPRRDGCVLVRVRGVRAPFPFRAVIGPGEGDRPAVVTVLRSGR